MARRVGDVAEVGEGAGSSGSFGSFVQGLAVKVIRKGGTPLVEAGGNVEQDVMWEVHVLQQLRHEHIVRVMDVIDVVDATYIIMEQIDGPELSEFMAMHE